MLRLATPGYLRFNHDWMEGEKKYVVEICYKEKRN